MGKNITEENVMSYLKDGKIILEENDCISPKAVEKAFKSDAEIFRLTKVPFSELNAIEEALVKAEECANENESERVVFTIVGKDRPGIISGVTSFCAKYKANILDISQTTLENLFAMIMLVDIKTLNTDISAFREVLEKYAENEGLKINIQHENIFNYMHRI